MADFNEDDIPMELLPQFDDSLANVICIDGLPQVRWATRRSGGVSETRGDVHHELCRRAVCPLTFTAPLLGCGCGWQIIAAAVGGTGGH